MATPRSYLTDSALGLGDAAPRAVPQDAALAVASQVLDGCVVVKVALIAALWLAGWGAARTATAVLDVGVAPSVVAATVTVWNPYVAERLLQGHWSLLVGYAALPWTVCACFRLRAGAGWPAWCALAVCLAAAGITPTGLLLATVVALVTIGRRRIPGVLGLSAVASAPWLAAALLGSGGASDPAGVAAFAARAEPGLGTLGSLAGLGGIWNADAVPGSRTGAFAFVATAALLAVVALGIPTLLRRRDLWGLAALGVGAVRPAGAGGNLVGPGALEWAAANVPGAGLLRDTQKWVALAAPVYALAAAAGCRAARRARSDRRRGPPSRCAPSSSWLLPDLIWASALRPVNYPARVGEVSLRRCRTRPGDVAVLPAGMFRIFDWAGDAPVLDPAPRLLPLDVLQTGELMVRGDTVHGEGTRATAVSSGCCSTGPTPPRWPTSASAGCWSSAPRAHSANRSAPSTASTSCSPTTTSRCTGCRDRRDTTNRQRAVVIAGHLLWAALLAGGLAGVVAAGLGRARNWTERGSGSAAARPGLRRVRRGSTRTAPAPPRSRSAPRRTRAPAPALSHRARRGFRRRRSGCRRRRRVAVPA